MVKRFEVEIFHDADEFTRSVAVFELLPDSFLQRFQSYPACSSFVDDKRASLFRSSRTEGAREGTAGCELNAISGEELVVDRKRLRHDAGVDEAVAFEYRYATPPIEQSSCGKP